VARLLVQIVPCIFVSENFRVGCLNMNKCVGFVASSECNFWYFFCGDGKVTSSNIIGEYGERSYGDARITQTHHVCMSNW
jgi:hypothetical protein